MAQGEQNVTPLSASLTKGSVIFAPFSVRVISFFLLRSQEDQGKNVSSTKLKNDSFSVCFLSQEKACAGYDTSIY